MNWRISSAYPCYYHLVLDDNDSLVAACRDFEQARLIATAPLMLEALEEIVALNPDPDSWCQGVAVCEQCKEIARAAIAATKGENDGLDS